MFDVTELKKAVSDSGLKQYYIANQLKISGKTLSYILNGKSKCTVDTYVGLCGILKKPVGSFITTRKSA